MDECGGCADLGLASLPSHGRFHEMRPPWHCGDCQRLFIRPSDAITHSLLYAHFTIRLRESARIRAPYPRRDKAPVLESKHSTLELVPENEERPMKFAANDSSSNVDLSSKDSTRGNDSPSSCMSSSFQSTHVTDSCDSATITNPLEFVTGHYEASTSSFQYEQQPIASVNKAYRGMSDKEYEEIKAFIEHGQYPDWPKSNKPHDIVDKRHNYRRKAKAYTINPETGRLMYTKAGNGAREIVRAGEEEKVISRAHIDSISAVHRGVNMTLRNLGAVYWPGMRKDVAHFVRHCKECDKMQPDIYRFQIPHDYL